MPVNCISWLRAQMLIAGVPSGTNDHTRIAHADVERAFSSTGVMASGYSGGDIVLFEASNARNVDGCLDGQRGPRAEDVDMGGG